MSVPEGLCTACSATAYCADHAPIRYTIQVYDDEILPVLLSEIPLEIKVGLIHSIIAVHETAAEFLKRPRRKRKERAA